MGIVEFYFDGNYVGRLTGPITKSDKTTVWLDLGKWGTYRFMRKDVEFVCEY